MPMSSPKNCSAFMLTATLTLTLAPTLATAQPAGQGVGGELAKTPGQPLASGTPLEEQPSVIFEIKGWSEYTFEADINAPSTGAGEDGPSFSVARLGGQFGVSGRFGESESAQRWRWTGEVSAEGSWYEFDGSTAFVPGSPVEDDLVNDVVLINLNPGVLYKHSDSLTFIGGAILQFAGEPEADVGESATYGGYIGSRVQLTDTFALRLGAAVKTRLEDNVGFVPAIGFDWNINEKVRLNTEGLGLKLTATVHPDWSIFILGAYANREYRLDDRPGSSLDEGVFREQRFNIGVGAEWRPSAKSSVTLTGGAVPWAQVRFDDQGGVELAEEDADPTAFIGIIGRLQF